MRKTIHWKNCVFILVGSAILSFGLYHIHSFSNITEGGVLGLTLLIHHHLGISPSVSGLILNFLCYLFGFLVLGKSFILYSAIAGVGFSLFYAVFEQFPPIYPSIGEHPLAAAVLGAVFVGIGAGISVRYGGATGGDDALAMGICKLKKNVKIQWIYFISDLVVLLLSLTYIPFSKLIYSLLTVILSGQILGFINDFDFQKIKKKLSKKEANISVKRSL